MKISAKSSSFQAAVNVKIPTAAMPGNESGSRIRNNAPSWVVPSTIACSSRSGGTLRKYPESSHVESGIENVM